MSAATNSMRGGDAVPFEEDGDVQRGTPDPGLKHLRKITLTPDEEREYASLCSDWLPGTHVATLCAGGFRKQSVTLWSWLLCLHTAVWREGGPMLHTDSRLFWKLESCNGFYPISVFAGKYTHTIPRSRKKFSS